MNSHDQENFSTQSFAGKTQKGFFVTDEHSWRAQCNQQPPRQRQEALIRLKTLTAQADFQAIYESGQKQVSRSFVVFFRPGVDFRYAVVASRKTIGIAVKRNRAKRLLRELIWAALGDWPASAAMPGPEDVRLKGDFIVVARASLLERKFADLKNELGQCLKNCLSV